MVEPALPVATVRTLLLTDVVDSTRLVEELGDAAMASLWARHDRLARDLLPTHRGREIDKTDGFLLLFEQVGDAVGYAVAYHRALRALGVAARAGVHVGPVILTENVAADVARGAKPLEVDGLAKPTAARVMSAAVGGQTLLTREAADALEADAGSDRWRSFIEDAVRLSAPYALLHAEALAVRAQLRVRVGETESARGDVEAARALRQKGRVAVVVALADAYVAHAEGRVDAVSAALQEAERGTAEAHLGALSPTGRELAAARTLVQGADAGVTRP